MVVAALAGYYFSAIGAVLVVAVVAAIVRRGSLVGDEPRRIPGYCRHCDYHLYDHSDDGRYCPKRSGTYAACESPWRSTTFEDQHPLPLKLGIDPDADFNWPNAVRYHDDLPDHYFRPPTKATRQIDRRNV